MESVSSSLNKPFEASATIGGSYSKTNYHAEGSTAISSSVSAGRNVNASAGRDVNIEGGRIGAANDVDLEAGRDINVFAARNTGDSKFSSESGGGGVGVEASIGAGGAAAGFNVRGQASGANSKGGSTSYVNSNIYAGNVLSTVSGRDTNVVGANMEGGSVWMDVGRDLSIASIQGSSSSSSSSWSAGASVTVGYGANVDVGIGGGFGWSSGGGNGNWVGQQTSIHYCPAKPPTLTS